MYSSRHVSRRIALAERDLHDSGAPMTLVQREVWEIDDFEERLRRGGKYLYGSTGLPIATQNLSHEESAWMLNEQLLVMCDAAYAITRYGMVTDEEGVIRRFQFRMAQQLLFNVVADLEDRDAAIEIMILKARQLGMCLKPDNRVLTADLRWILIDDVKVGDELVSIDEHVTSRPNKKAQTRRMRTSKVEARMERIHETIEITLDTGAILTATPEHPFLCCARGSVWGQWRKTGDIKVGDKIRRVVDVWEDGDKEDAWLGGLIDGEGCLREKHNAGVELSVSQVSGKVMDRARSLILERYSPAREEIDDREKGTSSKLGSQPVHKLTVGRMETIFKLLGRCRPTRFIDRRWWEDKGLPGKKIGGQWATVVAVRPAGKQRVVNIQTTTGTFVAEGVVSHNTTVVELLILFRIIFSNGVNAIIASADRQKSKMMAKKLLMGYDMLPIWLRPQYTSRVETENGELTFGQLNSGVYVQHGNQMSGIARGSTPTLYHLSECASFTNAKEQIEASLFKAVHPSPSIFGILESTGEGDEGWWAETWHYSKSNWAARTCRLCPIFFPWVIGRDLYPKPAWLRMRPVPEGWYSRRLPDTREHVARVEAYIALTPLLRKQLGSGWTMPIEQQWFWEVGHEEHKAKGLESIWYQEMAGDDIEALQRSQESVFGHDTMVEVEKAAKPDFLCYGISGQSIEDDYEPPVEDIDYGTRDNPKSRLPVVFNSPRGDAYRWELIPLKHDSEYLDTLRTKPDSFRDYANGKLLVFHPPTPGVDYSIGVDTSNGMGEDSTVICVTAPASRRGQPDIQVAEFRSAFVSHVQAYAFIMCIAAYYSQYMESTTSHRNPLVGVEQIASVGDVAQVQMRKMGYTRFPPFIRYDGKDLKKSKSRKIGWYTNSWSRPILIDSFVHSVQNGWYVINSPWLIDECKHFEVHYTASGKEKKEHEEGEHDDGLFAAAISEIIVNDLKSMTERSKKRFGDPATRALPPIDVHPYRGNTFSTKSDSPHAITMEEIIYSSTSELDRWK